MNGIICVLALEGASLLPPAQALQINMCAVTKPNSNIEPVIIVINGHPSPLRPRSWVSFSVLTNRYLYKILLLNISDNLDVHIQYGIFIMKSRNNEHLFIAMPLVYRFNNSNILISSGIY